MTRTMQAAMDMPSDSVGLGLPGGSLERQAHAAARATRPERLSRAVPGPQRVSRAQAAPQGAGAPLGKDVLGDMKDRLGHDFASVRVHADSAGAAASQALSARAYAFGEHISFDAGEYQPHSPAGRELIAHELAHVVQQRGGAPMVQREPKKEEPPPAAKTDVALVLSDNEQDMAEGGAYAPKVLRVTNAEDAAAQLKALKAPIGKVFVVSHSTSAGEVQFSSASGTVSWVKLRELSQALKGAATIDEFDFRGCKIGEAGGALESFRSALGLQAAGGSNCWTFVERVTPLTYDGAEITRPDQIPTGMQSQFDKALLQQIQGLKSEDGKPVQNCLLGLAPGEKAGTKTLSKIWKLYWANQGNLVASWASPDYDKTWQAGSLCTKDMSASTTPCGLVQAKAPT